MDAKLQNKQHETFATHHQKINATDYPDSEAEDSPDSEAEDSSVSEAEGSSDSEAEGSSDSEAEDFSGSKTEDSSYMAILRHFRKSVLPACARFITTEDITAKLQNKQHETFATHYQKINATEDYPDSEAEDSPDSEAEDSSVSEAEDSSDSEAEDSSDSEREDFSGSKTEDSSCFITASPYMAILRHFRKSVLPACDRFIITTEDITHIDYLDDEQERIAKQRAKNRKEENSDEVVEITAPNEIERRPYCLGASPTHMAANCFKPRRNHMQSLRPGSTRAAHSLLPIRSFVSTPPPSGNADFGPLGIPSWGQSERHTPNSTTFDYFSSRPSSQIRQELGTTRAAHSLLPIRSFVSTPPPSGNADFGPLGIASWGQSERHTPNSTTFDYLSSRSSQIRQESPFPQSSAPSPRPFESPPVYSTPSWSLGNSIQTGMSTREHFTTLVSAASAPSYVSASPQVDPAHYVGAPQQNPVTLMAAPQNNVPLQQQLLLQTQQSGTNFLSQPPPNYNPYQNSRTFGTQNPLQQSTETPTSRPTAPNAANQSFSNQNIFSTTDYHTGVSNVNVSPFSNNSLNINRIKAKLLELNNLRQLIV